MVQPEANFDCPTAETVCSDTALYRMNRIVRYDVRGALPNGLTERLESSNKGEPQERTTQHRK